MAFSDYKFPGVGSILKLQISDADLFPEVTPYPIREVIAEVIRDGAALALANSSEKAKSEYMIAPVFLELRRIAGGEISVFSGVEWDADPDRGLNGCCDFLLTRGGSEHILRAPFVAVVEAKNDLIRTGLGQCIAAMYAARVCNERDDIAPGSVFGVVSTGGAAWKFLRLDGDAVRLDRREYFIDNLPQIMGVLLTICGIAPRPTFRVPIGSG